MLARSSPTTTACPASHSSIYSVFCNQPPSKHALAIRNADLALIASEYVYQEILQHEDDNAAYEPVDIRLKETTTRAWLRIFGSAVIRHEAVDGHNSWPSVN